MKKLEKNPDFVSNYVSKNCICRSSHLILSLIEKKIIDTHEFFKKNCVTDKNNYWFQNDTNSKWLNFLPC